MELIAYKMFILNIVKKEIITYENTYVHGWTDMHVLLFYHLRLLQSTLVTIMNFNTTFEEQANSLLRLEIYYISEEQLVGSQGKKSHISKMHEVMQRELGPVGGRGGIMNSLSEKRNYRPRKINICGSLFN